MNKKRREERQQQAKGRQAKRDARSDTDQIHVLIQRGHGHCKEVFRLHERIKKEGATE